MRFKAGLFLTQSITAGSYETFDGRFDGLLDGLVCLPNPANRREITSSIIGSLQCSLETTEQL